MLGALGSRPALDDNLGLTALPTCQGLRFSA
jgi:hypothetical protein